MTDAKQDRPDEHRGSTRDVEILSRERLFKHYLAIDRCVLRHRLHAGGTSRPISRDLIARGTAVGVLLFDPDRDVVVLVEQFRIGAYCAGFDPWVLEIVAGMVGPGESAADVACREAREEAGARVDALIPISRHLASPGFTDETVETFLGRIDSAGVGGIHGLAEEDEDIRVVAMPVAEAFAACADGRIANAMTLIALQWLALADRGRLAPRWRPA
jgi:ADP-ribose pyrophosphatase